MDAPLINGWLEEPPDNGVVPEMPAWLLARPPIVEEAPPTLTVGEVESVFAELEALKAAAAAAGPVEVWRLDDRGLLAELAAAFTAATVAHARWLGLLAEADRRGTIVATQHMPASSWLAAGTTHSARQARADVTLAGLLGEYPQVWAALEAGRMSVEQAAAIVHGLQLLPDDLDTDQRAAVEAHLVGLAAEFDPTCLRRLVHHAVDVVAPQIGEERARKAAERAEREQQRSKYVKWHTDRADGGVRFHGKLPSAEGELFKAHLSALAAGQRAADATMGVDTSQGQALAGALALVVAHHASCAGGPARGGDHTRVIVTLTLDGLKTGIGVGALVESGDPITAAQARRLACTAGVLPLVLDGDSLPLDLGRSQRLFTPAQRLVLAVRDGGCAFPGCDRPPADCEAHHARTPWHAGGHTNISEGLLLCPHHHHLVEPDLNRSPEKNWRITFDTSGKAVFHTPAGRDGQRTIKQHRRYRT